jgi:uncharacterized protein Smg (DUF494 family)
MKRYKLLLVALLLMLVVFFMLDHHLFYYGRNDFNLYSSLPLKIKPEYRFDDKGKFVLRDEFGFSIIEPGNTYKVDTNKIVMKNLVRYGFKSEELVATVEDNDQRRYNIHFSPDTSNLADGKLHVTVYTSDRTLKINSYKWINVEGIEGYIENIQLLRNYIRLIIISLLLFVTYVFFSDRRRKKI